MQFLFFFIFFLASMTYCGAFSFLLPNSPNRIQLNKVPKDSCDTGVRVVPLGKDLVHLKQMET